MIDDAKKLIPLLLPILGCVPAILLPLFGSPAWIGVVGATALFFGMVFVALSAKYKGEIEGMNFMRELWRR